jgi:hypothetical protein
MAAEVRLLLLLLLLRLLLCGEQGINVTKAPADEWQAGHTRPHVLTMCSLGVAHIIKIVIGPTCSCSLHI